MTGLIIKDFYTSLKEARIFLLFIILMALSQSSFMLTYAIFYSAMLPITALAYDERSKWPKYANMMPLSIQQIVGGKYIMGYLCVGAAALLAVCGNLFVAGIGKSMASTEEWVLLLLITCIAFLMQAINLPLMFWIGVERGRYLFILFVVVMISCASVIFEEISSAILQNKNGIIFLLGLFGLTLLVTLISFLISNEIYRRKK